MSLRLSELRNLHEKGFSLLYLREKEKRPIQNKWTTGPRMEWDVLESSFESKYNIGVRLGESSLIKGKGFLACIDVDIKNPKAKKRAAEKLNQIISDFPDINFCTVYSGSGGGSQHLYFASPKPFPMITIAKEKDMFEICVYSTGRQMVLPPSIHPDTGFEYKWKYPFRAKNLVVIPASHFEPFAESIAQTGTGEKITATDFKAVKVNLYETEMPIRMIKQIETGENVEDRSAALFSMALTMCKLGLSDNQILSVLSNPKYWISSAAYEHTKSNSRDRAVKWLNRYTLSKARYETNIMRKFENKPVMKKLSDDEADEAVEEVQDEIDSRFPDLDQNKKPRNTQRNVVYAIEKRLGGKILGLNQFSNRYVFLTDTMYGGVRGREVSDTDDLRLKQYISNHFRFEPSKETCFEAHTLVGLQNAFHPVRAYLESLSWDGEERLDGWLKSAFKAIGPDEYLEAVGRKVLTAAVTRVYEPGCKFDYMMILEGNQGKGKSTALKLLAHCDEWFTDGLGDIFSKDVVDQMSGKWIIEMGELAAIKGREKEQTKAFITRATDRVRMPFGRRSGDYPRQSIFIGSTNDEEYLTDESGNRRYWPIKIKRVDTTWILENRDQLWAEAKVRFDLGEDLFLTPELEKIAMQEQSKRQVIDEWEVKIQQVIDDESKHNGKLTATKIFQCFDGNIGMDPSHWESIRIGKVMRKLGYTRKSVIIGGVVTKGWMV